MWIVLIWSLRHLRRNGNTTVIDTNIRLNFFYTTWFVCNLTQNHNAGELNVCFHTFFILLFMLLGVCSTVELLFHMMWLINITKSIIVIRYFITYIYIYMCVSCVIMWCDKTSYQVFHIYHLIWYFYSLTCKKICEVTTLYFYITKIFTTQCDISYQ